MNLQNKENEYNVKSKSRQTNKQQQKRKNGGKNNKDRN